MSKKKNHKHGAVILAINWLKVQGAELPKDQPSLSNLFKMILAHPNCPPKLREYSQFNPWPARDVHYFFGNKVKGIHPAERVKQPRQPKVKKSRGDKYRTKKADPFYDSDTWKELRYRVLTHYGAACQCCGATRADRVKLHVDHIKPRSKFPELALVFENLQILCEDCNLGKGAKDQTDWRPKLTVVS